MAERRHTTPDNLRAVRERVREGTTDLVDAYNGAELERTVSFFSPEIVFMPADRPALSGIPALRAHLERTFASGVKIVSLTREYFVATEEVVVLRGTYLRRLVLGHLRPVVQRGHYELTWRLQDDGEYRVTSWIFGRGVDGDDGDRDGNGDGDGRGRVA